MKFAAVDENTCVRSRDNYGPYWGTTSSDALFIDPKKKDSGKNYSACGVYVRIANGFQTNGLEDKDLHGSNSNLYNIEVYAVEG